MRVLPLFLDLDLDLALALALALALRLDASMKATCVIPLVLLLYCAFNS